MIGWRLEVAYSVASPAERGGDITTYDECMELQVRGSNLIRLRNNRQQLAACLNNSNAVGSATDAAAVSPVCRSHEWDLLAMMHRS